MESNEFFVKTNKTFMKTHNFQMKTNDFPMKTVEFFMKTIELSLWKHRKSMISLWRGNDLQMEMNPNQIQSKMQKDYRGSLNGM